MKGEKAVQWSGRREGGKAVDWARKDEKMPRYRGNVGPDII
jgi:hypothetical protein